MSKGIARRTARPTALVGAAVTASLYLVIGLEWVKVDGVADVEPGHQPSPWFWRRSRSASSASFLPASRHGGVHRGRVAVHRRHRDVRRGRSAPRPVV